MNRTCTNQVSVEHSDITDLIVTFYKAAYNKGIEDAANVSGDHTGNQPELEVANDVARTAVKAARRLQAENDRLRKIEAAQLAELEAISAALGTNEGHSSVTHIERLRAEVECLQNELAHWMNHWRTKL